VKIGMCFKNFLMYQAWNLKWGYSFCT